MKKAGIVGGTGYTAGELIRLLLHHPSIEIDFVYSHSKPGVPVHEVHRDLLGQTEQVFTDTINPEADIVFLCLGHGHSREFLETHTLSPATRVVDLSNEFRLSANSHYQGHTFVYGLTELHAERIAESTHIANPGCFATAMQLALLPLAQRKLLDSTVHVNAVTGSTGAGGGMKETSMFSWRLSNLSYYKPFVHQHLGEISESLATLGSPDAELLFLPIRGNFSRGIFATAYLPVDAGLPEIEGWYREFYGTAPFTHISSQPVDLKQVVNTNHCFIHLHKHEGILLITSVIDNLLKGASGQALENANLIFGFDQREGLHLKSIAH